MYVDSRIWRDWDEDDVWARIGHGQGQAPGDPEQKYLRKTFN